MGIITIHCSQYTQVFHVENGEIQRTEAFRLGKEFNKYLVPEPISKIMHAKASSLTNHANIEQRITAEDVQNENNN